MVWSCDLLIRVLLQHTHHSDFIIQSFHGAGRKLAFCSKPIENEFLVGAQHARNSVHRFQPAAHGSSTPNLEKSSRPGHMSVTPEVFEALLQLPSSAGGQLTPKQTHKLLPRAPPERTATTQQLPAHVFQLLGFGFACRPQARALASTHFI